MSLGISTADLLSESLSTKAYFNGDSIIGDTVTGTVVDFEVRQTRNFDDNKLEFWDDNSPRTQIVINIQTDLEPENADDDGIRAVYIKWWGESRKAFLKAIKDADASDLAAGGRLTASYIGDGDQPDKKKAKPKLYAYGYTVPGPVALAGK